MNRKSQPCIRDVNHYHRQQFPVKQRRRSLLSRRKRPCVQSSFNYEALEAKQLLATVIYSDSLATDWQNWSWGTTIDFDNDSPVESGTRSMAITHNSGWTGAYLAQPNPVDVLAKEEVRFQVHGGSTGGQVINVFIVDGNSDFLNAGTLTLEANQWNEVTLHINELGNPYQVGGIVFQDATGNEQQTYYIDQVEIGDLVSEPDRPDVEGPTITVNAQIVGNTISEEVYGLNFADEAFAQEIGLKVNRWGGNSTSRYNHEIETTNLASDFYFENMPNSAEGSSDAFITNNQDVGSDSIITIGMLDWMPKSNVIEGSYSVAKYGAQQDTNMYRPDHGNGIRTDGSRITDNDPLDTSVPSDENFARNWVQEMVADFGSAADGGVKYYALGNEPMLWNSTHMDVHPQGASYDEVLEKGIRYASAIKNADPSALVLGPVSWGWQAYFYSGLDAAGEGEWWLNPQDRNAHGGTPFLEWYLQEMAAHEAENGERLLDYLDIHYYPQGDNIALEGAGDLERQAARLESVRSLWDPNHTDDSWINEKINLVPRMHDWIDNNYAETKLAITEYNFGAGDHVNGALAQADVLGAFGREGVDLATLWAPPESSDPMAFAFRMFRNYDGAQNATSRFGEQSVEANTGDYDQVAVYASTRAADGKMTVMLINKTHDTLVSPIEVGSNASEAEVYVYGEGDRTQIRQLQNEDVVDGTLSMRLEPQSITLLEIQVGQTSAPTVSDVVLAGGDAQRSSLRSLEVRFDSIVGFANNDPLSAFSMTRNEGGSVGLSVAEINNSTGITILTLEFSGGLTRGNGALVDGNYQLSIDGSQYYDATSNQAGVDFVFGDNDSEDDLFYSLFGDIDGNRTVNIVDRIQFRGTIGSQAGDDDFDSAFDYNGDGVINIQDRIQFRTRIGTSI